MGLFNIVNKTKETIANIQKTAVSLGSDAIESLTREAIAKYVETVFSFVLKKVNPNKVKQWRPSDTLVFVNKAFECWKENEIKCESQYATLKELLIQDKEKYIDSVYLAQHVYGAYGNAHELPNGWQVANLPRHIVLHDKKTSLKSQLYYRHKNGKKEYVYATAGTNPLNLTDWQNNIAQLCGESDQYEEAMLNAKEIAKMVKNENADLWFVGHSLGGGLAMYNSMATAFPAIVFNPAGISSETKSKLEFVPTEEDINKRITVFCTTNDLLTLLQDASQHFEGMKSVFPNACGTRYYLAPTVVSEPLSSHTIQVVVSSMTSMVQS